MKKMKENLEAGAEMQERELEAALGYFRAAVKGWSEQESARPQGEKSEGAKNMRVIPWWVSLTRPVTAGALAAGIAVATIAVPVLYQHQTKVQEQQARKQGSAPAPGVVPSEQQGRLEASVNLTQNPAADLAKEVPARRTSHAAIDDEELLWHVDSDISQSAPDALQPLASLMSETP